MTTRIDNGYTHRTAQLIRALFTGFQNSPCQVYRQAHVTLLFDGYKDDIPPKISCSMYVGKYNRLCEVKANGQLVRGE